MLTPKKIIVGTYLNITAIEPLLDCKLVFSWWQQSLSRSCRNYRVPLGITRITWYYQALSGNIWHSQVSPGISKHYKALPGITRHYQVSSDIAKYYQVLGVLPDISGITRLLAIARNYYLAFPEITRTILGQFSWFQGQFDPPHNLQS